MSQVAGLQKTYVRTYVEDGELGEDTTELHVKEVLGELDLSHVDCDRRMKARKAGRQSSSLV